jgi:hypothetical protein
MPFRTSNGDSVPLGRSEHESMLFAGRFRNAVVQSVGAGCCAAGTPSIQIRHLPAGGSMDRGDPRPESRDDAGGAPARTPLCRDRNGCGEQEQGQDRARGGRAKMSPKEDDSGYPVGTGRFRQRVNPRS